MPFSRRLCAGAVSASLKALSLSKGSVFSVIQNLAPPHNRRGYAIFLDFLALQ